MPVWEPQCDLSCWEQVPATRLEVPAPPVSVPMTSEPISTSPDATHRPMPSGAPTRHDRGIVVIALFKMLKAVLLILAGAGMLSLLRPSAATEVQEWLAQLTMLRGQQLVQRALALLDAASPLKLTGVGLASITYGVLFATEGIGLWLEKRWAEYLTIVATGSFIPFELYELVRKLTVVRAGALVANIAAVAYLVYRLRHPVGVRRELR